MQEGYWLRPGPLHPRVRERLIERLEFLRTLTDDVISYAKGMSDRGMNDEELVNWIHTLHQEARSIVQAWTH